MSAKVYEAVNILTHIISRNNLGRVGMPKINIYKVLYTNLVYYCHCRI